MSNLDVTLAGFWQLARHWKQGNKANLELSCENRRMEIHLSAVLGHPDLVHFPPPFNPPPPPPSSAPIKRQSRFKLRWQERRRKAAEKASSCAHFVSEITKIRLKTIYRILLTKFLNLTWSLESALSVLTIMIIATVTIVMNVKNSLLKQECCFIL